MTSSEELEKKGLVYRISAISALRGSVFNAWRVVWQPFVLSLGVSMSWLGGLESFLDLTRIAVMPLFGKAADAHGRRRFIVAREILTLAAAVLYVYAGSWRFIFLGVMLTGLSLAIYPIWNTVIAESTEGRELGYTYSIVGTITLGLSLVATLAAGYVASAYGFRTVFTGAAVLALLAFLLVVMRLPETLPPEKKGSVNWRELTGSFVETLRPPRYLWGFYIAMSVDLFAFNLGYRLLNGMLASEYGYTPAMLGLISAATIGATAVAQIPLGRLVDRIGYVKFLIISQLIACVVLATFVVSKSFLAVVAAQIALGVSAAFWTPAEQAWIAVNVDPERRAQAIGGFSTFRGLIAFPAPFIGGLLFDAYGFDVPILINLGIALIDVILIYVLVKERVRPDAAAGAPETQGEPIL